MLNIIEISATLSSTSPGVNSLTGKSPCPNASASFLTGIDSPYPTGTGPLISVLAARPKYGIGFFGKNEEMSVSQVNQLLRSLENSIPIEYQDRQKVFSKYADTFYEQFKIVKYPSKPFDCGPSSSRSERFPDWNY